MDSLNNEQEPMTLEKLARIIAAGFEHSATKVEIKSLEEKVDKIDQRLRNIEKWKTDWMR